MKMKANWLVTFLGGSALGSGAALRGVETGLGTPHHVGPTVLLVVGLLLSIVPPVLYLRARRS